MDYITTKALVLKAIHYSDSDMVVKCYTEAEGLKSYLIKGIFKAKKGKLKAAMFQPFSQLELVARHKNRGSLNYIKEARIDAINPSIRENIKKSSMAMFLSEVIQNAVWEEEENKPLYHFLEEAVQWLETHREIANFHLYFLVQFTKYLGIFPNLPEEYFMFFNLRQGCFEPVETDKYSVSGKKCQLLKILMKTVPKDLPELKLNGASRSKFLVFILSYYEMQLEGFREPKSLLVLSQLYA